MYERSFQLEIITPEKIVLQDEASSLSAPGSKGGFQVLYNHAPLLSTLEIGELKVKDKNGTDTSYAVSGGFVEVRDNMVVVLVETAERAGEIDVDRAKAARARAYKRLHEKFENIDHERARGALMRAVNRLRIAAK
jgi:F-type H+-transporting ATPase subunit epsilon